MMMGSPPSVASVVGGLRQRLPRALPVGGALSKSSPGERFEQTQLQGHAASAIFFFLVFLSESPSLVLLPFVGRYAPYPD
jgi:hypothetical protein